MRAQVDAYGLAVCRPRILRECDRAFDAGKSMIALRQQQRIRIEQCQPTTDLLAAEWVLAAHRALAEQRHTRPAFENRLPRPWPARVLEVSEARVELGDSHDEALFLLLPEVVGREDVHDVAVDLRDHIGDAEAPRLNLGRGFL